MRISDGSFLGKARGLPSSVRAWHVSRGYDGGPFEYNNVQLSSPSATVLFAHYLVASAWPLRAVFIPAATARPTKTQDTRRGELS